MEINYKLIVNKVLQIDNRYPQKSSLLVKHAQYLDKIQDE